MVTFFISLLGISIAGIVTLLAVKRWELSSGRLVLSTVRPAAGRVLGMSLHFFERQAPAMLSRAAKRAYAYARAASHRIVAWAVLHVEDALEKTLHTLRGATQERGDGEASPFLREVAEHKKSLLERSGKEPNAIYEE